MLGQVDRWSNILVVRLEAFPFIYMCDVTAVIFFPLEKALGICEYLIFPLSHSLSPPCCIFVIFFCVYFVWRFIILFIYTLIHSFPFISLVFIALSSFHSLNIFPSILYTFSLSFFLWSITCFYDTPTREWMRRKWIYLEYHGPFTVTISS